MGPEHAWLKDSGRAQYVGATGDEGRSRRSTCCRIEGIIPALESSHALAHAARAAPTLDKDKIILVNLSGRGDKDLHIVAEAGGLEFFCRASCREADGLPEGFVMSRIGAEALKRITSLNLNQCL